MTKYAVELVANEEPLFKTHRNARLRYYRDDDYTACYDVTAPSPLDAARFLCRRLPEMDRDQLVTVSADFKCWTFAFCPETGNLKEWR